MSNKSILLASFKMAIATFLSRILGLVREQVMAFYFGASGLTDAFLVAYKIPNLLRDLFAEGAFSAAFVPSFTKSLQLSHKRAQKLLWSLFISLFLVTGVISVIIVIFAPQFISLFAPSFANYPLKYEIAVNSVRIMGPFLLMISWAALFMGALNSLKVFFWPSVAPAIFNVVMIAAVLILYNTLPIWGFHPIYALPLGVMLGGIVQAFVQYPLLVRRDFSFEAPGPLLNEDSRAVFYKLGPGLLGFAASQINLIINTILATGCIAGAVSFLNYAFRLFQFPIGVLGVSVSNSNLVHFSEAWKKGEREEALELLGTSYRLSLVLMIGALALLYASAYSVVQLVFEHGRFSAESSQMTSLALRCYALGLPFYGIYKVFVPTFYALEKPKIPVISSFISIAINIVFCLSLVSRFGFQVLAIGTGLSMLINSSILSWMLHRELKVGANFFFNKRVLKLLIILFLLTPFLMWWEIVWAPYFSIPMQFIRLCVIMGSGLLIYLLFLQLFGEISLSTHWSRLLKKIKK